jgi:HEAT repeat protein
MHTLRWVVPAVCVLALAGSSDAQNLTTSPLLPTPYEVGGRTLKQWMAELTHPDPCRRADALVSILGFGAAATEAVPLVLARCSDRDPSPRAKAVIVLKFIPVREKDTPKVVETLGRLLAEDTQAIVRYEAAMALNRFAEDAKPVVLALLRGVEDPCWETRQACITVIRRAALDKKAGPDTRATRALIHVLQADPAEKVRLEATLTLGAMGKPADPQLLLTVQQALQHQLGYHDKALTLWSHVSLMALDDKVTDQSLAAIKKLFRSTEREIRVQCVMAMAAMGEKARACIPEVIAALDDKEVPVVVAACRALSRMDDHSPRVLNGLIKITERPEQQAVYAACEALGDIGVTHEEVMTALEAVVKRNELEPQLRQSVNGIIEKMKKPKKK